MGNLAGRSWRLFATALSFSLFGVGATVLSLTVFPAMLLLVRDRARRQRLAQTTICTSFRLVIRMVEALGIAEFHVAGEHRLRGLRSKVIIANHPTMFDVVILLSRMDRCQCVVKHDLFRNPFITAVIRAAGYIRNDDDPERLIATVARHLADGSSVIIFPEGTRTPTGIALGRARRGVANIAIAARADLIPVVVSCNHTILRKGMPWYRIPPTKIRYDLTVEDPMAIEKLLDSDLPRAQQARAITNEITNFFLKRLTDGTPGNRDQSAHH